MAANYTELVALVRNWSNRDADVLSDAIIQDTIRYAADKAYRTLRVPPLEHIVTYNSTTLTANTSSAGNRLASVTSLQIPGDLIEFIQLREVDSEGATVRIFNEKADIRTFRDTYAEKYNDLGYWTREADRILYAPGFGTGAANGLSTSNPAVSLELYYYRRLPALNARYDVTVSNYNLGLLAEQNSAGVDTNLPAPSPAATALPTPASGTTLVGQEVPNWLRDENERILLFGALAESFAFLQENEEAQKYAALFTQEILELNKEDQMRNASGGNVQINFNGRGLI